MRTVYGVNEKELFSILKYFRFSDKAGLPSLGTFLLYCFIQPTITIEV